MPTAKCDYDDISLFSQVADRRGWQVQVAELLVFFSFRRCVRACH